MCAGGPRGTRDTDALNPINNRKVIHAVFLAGGSSFGLDAGGGIMSYLEERHIGRDVGVTCVPNVCGAILFDLTCGSSLIRPDAGMGYQACLNAMDSTSGQTLFPEGNFGAGTGATIGKSLGRAQAMKGGIGSAAFSVGDLQVGAIMAVNCVGDVYDQDEGRVIAGMLNSDRQTLLSSERLIVQQYERKEDFYSGNTILGCIITNAILDKAQATKLASVGHDGIARAIRPAHSVYDGDTLFALCTQQVEASQDAVGILAAYVVEKAIVQAIRKADSIHGYLSFKDLG